MPVRDVAAKRYAQAVFAIARDEDALERWQADLASLAALMAEPTVAQFLQSSKMEAGRKFEVLEQALPNADAKAVSLAKLLVRKGRTRIAGEIALAFDELCNAARGVAVARVTTATPLTDQGRATIVDAIRRSTGAGEVRLEEAVNQEILGGALVQIGDRVVDGSVRTRLAALKRSIAS